MREEQKKLEIKKLILMHQHITMSGGIHPLSKKYGQYILQQKLVQSLFNIPNNKNGRIVEMFYQLSNYWNIRKPLKEKNNKAERRDLCMYWEMGVANGFLFACTSDKLWTLDNQVDFIYDGLIWNIKYDDNHNTY